MDMFYIPFGSLSATDIRRRQPAQHLSTVPSCTVEAQPLQIRYEVPRVASPTMQAARMVEMNLNRSHTHQDALMRNECRNEAACFCARAVDKECCFPTFSGLHALRPHRATAATPGRICPAKNTANIQAKSVEPCARDKTVRRDNLRL